MDKQKNEKFKGAYNTVYVVAIFMSIGILFGIMENGIQKYAIYGFWLFLAYIILMSLIAYFTSTTITDDKRLICKKPLEFSGFNIDIFEITRIDRTSEFIFKSWGSRLQIYHTNSLGQNNWHTIREANYEVETIKRLLKRIKEINLSIKLHPQYQNLIDDKIKNEDDFKKLRLEVK